MFKVNSNDKEQYCCFLKTILQKTLEFLSEKKEFVLNVVCPIHGPFWTFWTDLYVCDQRGLKCQPWFAMKHVYQPYTLLPVIWKAGNVSSVTVVTFILL